GARRPPGPCRARHRPDPRRPEPRPRRPAAGPHRLSLRLVLATANPDKAREIADALSGFDLVPRPEDVPEVDETADTLEGNARLKAVALCAATGEAAVADDTGLEVDALGGRPGVFSSRFSGPNATYADNVAKLLRDLDGVDNRRARFRTVALARFPDGRDVIAEGTVDGQIA